MRRGTSQATHPGRVDTRTVGNRKAGYSGRRIVGDAHSHRIAETEPSTDDTDAWRRLADHLRQNYVSTLLTPDPNVNKDRFASRSGGVPRARRRVTPGDRPALRDCRRLMATTKKPSRLLYDELYRSLLTFYGHGGAFVHSGAEYRGSDPIVQLHPMHFSLSADGQEGIDRATAALQRDIAEAAAARELRWYGQKPESPPQAARVVCVKSLCSWPRPGRGRIPLARKPRSRQVRHWAHSQP